MAEGRGKSSSSSGASSDNGDKNIICGGENSDFVGHILADMVSPDCNKRSAGAKAPVIKETDVSVGKGKSSGKVKAKNTKEVAPSRPNSQDNHAAATRDMDFLKAALTSLAQKVDTLVPVVTQLKSAYDYYATDDALDSGEQEEACHLIPHEDASCEEMEEGQITEPPLSADNLLQQLNDSVRNQNDKGPAVEDALAKVVTQLLQQGMHPDNQAKVLAKYPTPANCSRLEVVRVNPEVFNNVLKDVKTNDILLQKAQKPILTGITAVVQLMDRLLKSQKGNGDLPTTNELLAGFSDAISLLTEGSHQLDLCRRAGFKAVMKDEFRSLCNETAPVTTLLFGDELNTTVKTLAESTKVTRQLTGFRPTRGGFRSDTRRGSPYRRPPFLGQGGRGQWRPRYPHQPQQNRFPRGRGQAPQRKWRGSHSEPQKKA